MVANPDDDLAAQGFEGDQERRGVAVLGGVGVEDRVGARFAGGELDVVQRSWGRARRAREAHHLVASRADALDGGGPHVVGGRYAAASRAHSARRGHRVKAAWGTVRRVWCSTFGVESRRSSSSMWLRASRRWRRQCT